MRDTVDYDLIVVMDAYDRAEVVREVSAAGLGGADGRWGAGGACEPACLLARRPPHVVAAPEGVVGSGA